MSKNVFIKSIFYLITFIYLNVSAVQAQKKKTLPPIKSKQIAESALNYKWKNRAKPPLKNFLYPDYFVKKMLPYYICEEKLAKAGYYDNFMAIFDNKMASSQTVKKFELKHVNKSWIVKREYKSGRSSWPVTLQFSYFDGNYAIFKDFDRFILLVDIRSQLIMAFTPSYMLKPEYLRTGQSPHFFNLYFLDKNLYPYASLDCNTGYQREKRQEFDGLSLSTYDYSKKALYQNHLSYKIQKKLSEIPYTDFIEFNKIVKNKGLTLENREKRCTKDEETIYKDVPLWIF